MTPPTNPAKRAAAQIESPNGVGVHCAKTQKWMAEIIDREFEPLISIIRDIGRYRTDAEFSFKKDCETMAACGRVTFVEDQIDKALSLLGEEKKPTQ